MSARRQRRKERHHHPVVRSPVFNAPLSERPDREIDRGVVLVLTLDLQQRIRHVSPGFSRTSGYRPAELRGQPFEALRHPDMPMQILRDVWQSLDEGASCVVPLKLRCQEGGHCWARAAFSQVVGRQGTLSTLVVLARMGPLPIRSASALFASMRTRTAAWLEALAAQPEELTQVLRW